MLKHVRKKAVQVLRHRSVHWNGEALPQQLLDECIVALHNTFLTDGYLCSACDPLLLAFAAVFSVNVQHQYGSEKFLFEPQVEGSGPPRATIFLSSSSGHMPFETMELHANEPSAPRTAERAPRCSHTAQPGKSMLAARAERWTLKTERITEVIL